MRGRIWGQGGVYRVSVLRTAPGPVLPSLLPPQLTGRLVSETVGMARCLPDKDVIFLGSFETGLSPMDKFWSWEWRQQ